MPFRCMRASTAALAATMPSPDHAPHCTAVPATPDARAEHQVRMNFSNETLVHSGFCGGNLQVLYSGLSSQPGPEAGTSK